MTSRTMQYKFNRCLIILFIILFTGCSSLSEKKSTPFDPQKVNSLAFKFEDNSNTLSTNLPQVEIANTVVSNLSQWGYSFDSKQHDHTLTINISDIRRGSTPAGFSFNIGNSDPRAINFQKADVISLTCALIPKLQTTQRAELVMEVMADELTELASQPENQAQLTDQLADDISTTCFNLLSSLNIKTVSVASDSSSAVSSPSWIPEIRIEIENIPEESSNKASSVTDKSEKPTAAVMENISVETEPVTTPKKQAKKRIIIHNQGSPVIFKFGHDRK